MAIKKCKRCKKLFAANNGNICPNCIHEEEEQFKKAKDYLWDKPGATIKEINSETGVPIRIIKKFIKEGRFIEMRGVNLTIDCERCGASIKSGRFCKSCSDKLKSGLTKEDKKKVKKDENNAENKMFVKDRLKRR